MRYSFMKWTCLKPGSNGQSGKEGLHKFVHVWLWTYKELPACGCIKYMTNVQEEVVSGYQVEDDSHGNIGNGKF